MILYKIQHTHTKLFNQKRMFYWSEKSRWSDTGTYWTSLEEINSYLSQFAKTLPYGDGVDISDWQIVKYVAEEVSTMPAIKILS